MSRQGISTGITPNDGSGDTLSAGAKKINENFQEIYDALGDGTDLLTGNPNLTVGFITATGASFTNNVSIGGTLDVTNIDSVGLITARDGISVLGAGITVTGISTFYSSNNNDNVTLNSGYIQSSLGISTNAGTTTAQINVDSTGSQLIITVPGVGSTSLPLT